MKESIKEHAVHSAKFFQHFMESHTREFFLHKEYGLGAPRWQQVTKHCLMEAAVCDVLGELLNLSKKERAELVTAALVHDFHTRQDLEKAATEGWQAINTAIQKSSKVLR